jgi:hypothetical protein
MDFIFSSMGAGLAVVQPAAIISMTGCQDNRYYLSDGAN